MRLRLLALLLAVAPLAQPQSVADALDLYIEEAFDRQQTNRPSAGSLFAEAAFLSDLARDPRAARVGDLVTVVVAERATALSSGAVSQSRESGSDSSITRLLGGLAAGGRLPNLFGQSGSSNLQGAASTSRQTNVAAVLTASVTQVMPNGNLVIEGAKEVAVNSERQLVWLRGVVRQEDLSQANSVGSERVALLDLRVNGRGVVQDAIRRPNPIYRFFKSLLPF